MKKELIKDNYYEAINGDWLETAEIPADQPQMSAFLELHLDIEKLLMDLAAKWSKDQTGLNKNLLKFVKLHEMTKDFETRDKLGSTPLQPIIERIKALKSLKDFEKNAKEMLLDGISTPFGYYVMQDFMNSNNQVLYFGATDLFLPDTSYYQDPATKEQLMGLFKMTTSQILQLYGLDPEKANEILEKAIAFDELLVPVTKSSVERADYVKMYNPMDKDEVISKTTTFNLMKLAESLVGVEVDKLIVTNPDFINKFDEIINEENFELIKSWMLVSNITSFSSLLTEPLRVASGAFMRALSGVAEPQAQGKFAFYQAYDRLSQVVGLYYGETYFGPEAKKDVENMVNEVINVYKERLEKNTWLNKDTKAKAILKLNKISVQIGYPEELPQYFDKYEVGSYEEGSNLVLESIKWSRLLTQDNYSKYNKEPNRNLWQMPASMVNAYYSPTNNQIVFPAAILQEPYYSVNQSRSANYGGIGAVIAHEISHAFDNNGAQFDEFGSLNNWWTEEDLKTFKEKSKKMIELFDGVETGNGPCNGELTVSENIADSGGIRSALEASKKDKNHNYEEFFTNWARVWRMKASPQFLQLLLTVDVHGPAVLRANMQLSNLPEFQDFYKLTEEDKMYLAKDKMVEIW
ncbi:MAG TPA: M13 family peptidase [Acholeplasmataceae bacterium]|nr:M13 family peptidase [Acholeplasmataceae bacterium]